MKIYNFIAGFKKYVQPAKTYELHEVRNIEQELENALLEAMDSYNLKIDEVQHAIHSYKLSNTSKK